MDYKFVFRIILLFCLVAGRLCIIGIEFCSGRSIKDYFDDSSKESALKLDGSDSAVSNLLPTKTGKLSCTCVVTPSSPLPDKLQVGFVYSARSADTKSCYKNLEVRQDGGELKHVFGCSSDDIELQQDNLEAGIQFTMNWFETSGKIDDMYYLYIAPEPGTVLKAQCYLPTQSSSTPADNVTESSTVTSTTKVTSATTTTTRAFVTAESGDTTIVVGVVIGLGLFFLFFISCMLCYIARRKVRRDVSKKPNPTEKSQPQHHSIVGRTLTHFYDKMKSNRPLPNLPASFRKITNWKNRNQNMSGVYDSIKSNNNNHSKHILNKQESQTSDCSYLEPVTITTISEAVSKSNLKPEEIDRYIELETPVSAKVTKNLELRGSETDAVYNSYIHPVPEYEKSSEKRDSRHRYVNEPSKQTYMNCREANAVGKDAQKENITDAEKGDTEIELNGSGYMTMDSKAASKNDVHNGIGKGNMGKKEINKDILVGTDSGGYMSMDSSDNIKTKDLLKQNDSIFPELIKFTPHDVCFKEKTCVVNDQEKGVEEMKNVKTKRYVRDKNSSPVNSKDRI